MERYDDSGFSLRDTLHIIFKRKLCILFFLFISLGIAGILSFLPKPIYKATAQILVKIGRESVFVPAIGNSTPIVNHNTKERINSEIGLLRSRSLAEKVVLSMGPTVIYADLNIEDPGLLEKIYFYFGLEQWEFLKKLWPIEHKKNLSPFDNEERKLNRAIAKLQKNSEFKEVKGSSLINLKYKHEDPRMAAMVVNNLASFYLEHRLKVHKTSLDAKFFQEQSESRKDELEAIEAKLEAIKQLNNITSIKEEKGLLLGQIADLRTNYNSTLSQEVEAEKRINQFRQQMERTPKTISRGEETNQNAFLISTLEARLVELELKEKELLSKYTDQSRLVRNVKDDIRMVREKLNEHESKRTVSRNSGINPTYQNIQELLLRNEAELSALKAKSQKQKNQLKEYKDELEKLNQVEFELNRLNQDLDRERENYRLYLSKYEESRISDAMDSEKIANVSLVELAKPPNKPIGFPKKLKMLIGLFCGIFGGLSLALFFEYFDDALEKPEDIERFLDTTVLSSVPRLSWRIKKTYSTIY